MTKEQLLKFIELVNAGTGYGGMRLMIAAEQAGFNIREIGKCTYGGGTYPVKTEHGVMYELDGIRALRDYTAEELHEQSLEPPPKTDAEQEAETKALVQGLNENAERHAKAAGMTVEQMDREFVDLVIWGFREGPTVQSIALV